MATSRLSSTSHRPPLMKQSYSERAEYLNRFIVPVEELDYPEYCASIDLDFTLTRKHPGYMDQMETIGRTVCAMLNFSGGVIFLKPQTAYSEKEMDQWMSNIHQYLQVFVPKPVLYNCIDIHITELWVKKSRTFITFKSNLYVRTYPSSIEVGSDMLQDVMRSRKQPRRLKYSTLEHFPLDQQSYGAVVNIQEGQNLEFKCYSTSGAESLLERLSNERFLRYLLAFANNVGGGHIIIGMMESRDGKFVVRGQELSQADECTVQERLSSLMIRGPDGEHRLWPSPYTGQELDISFHPISNYPGDERRVLVHIKVHEAAGCVFAAEPESYSMTSDGQIKNVPFSVWKGLIEQGMQRSVHGGHQAMSTQQQLSIPDVTEHEASQVPSQLVTDLRQHNRGSLSSSDISPLSWIHDTDNWQMDKASSHFYDISAKIEEIAKSDILEPTMPSNWIPSKATLKKWLMNHYQESGDVLDTVDGHYRDKTFVLGTSFLGDMFAEITVIKPQVHVLDLLVVHEHADIDIWVICRQADAVKKYVLSVIRMLHADLLGKLNDHGDTDTHSIAISGIIWSLESQTSQTISSPRTTTVPLSDLRTAIASSLLQGKSHIKNRLGESSSIVLTKQQLRALVSYDFADINIFEGPPGSGKSLMGLSICEEEISRHRLSKKQILYICPSQALSQFIKFQDKCNVTVLTEKANIDEMVKEALENNVIVIIIDDAQLIRQKKILWMNIFRRIHFLATKTHARLAILLDSEFQNYLPDTTNELLQAIKEYNGRYPYSHAVIHRLTEMLRNSRTIFSFFKSNAEEPTRKRLICRHDFQGDNVMVYYCNNFFMNSKDNPLMKLIKELVGVYEFEENFIYRHTDITVLIDSNGKGEGKEEVKKLIIIFRKFYLEAEVHDASIFPVTGLVIDEMRNFSGLESRVCIMALTSKDTSVMDNTRYRLFVASRGIMKVIFLLHSDSVKKSLQQLKFPEIKQWQKMSLKLWKEAIHHVLTSPDAEQWIAEQTPDTQSWRERTDCLLRLRQLLHDEGSVADLRDLFAEKLAKADRSSVMYSSLLYMTEKQYTETNRAWFEGFLSQVEPDEVTFYCLLYLLLREKPASEIQDFISTQITQDQKPKLFGAVKKWIEQNIPEDAYLIHKLHDIGGVVPQIKSSSSSQQQIESDRPQAMAGISEAVTHEIRIPYDQESSSDTILEETNAHADLPSLGQGSSDIAERKTQPSNKESTPPPVSDLQQFVVPRERLECAESTFSLVVDLSKQPRETPQLWHLIQPLLNSCGGIIKITPSKTMTSTLFDTWKLRTLEFLSNYIPSDVLMMYMDIDRIRDIGYVYVQVSPVPVFHSMNIFTRGVAGSVRVTNTEPLKVILTQETDSQTELPLSETYAANSVFPFEEQRNVELKCWLMATSPHKLLNMIKHDTRLHKTLLAMANLAAGGDVVFGVAEEATGQLRVRGQNLRDSSRSMLEDTVESVLINDPTTGEPRIWKDEGNKPEKNKDWFITYHKLTGLPLLEENKVLFRIRINHYPGGVFESSPIMYVINSEGFVDLSSITEWRPKLLKQRYQQQSMSESSTDMISALVPRHPLNYIPSVTPLHSSKLSPLIATIEAKHSDDTGLCILTGSLLPDKYKHTLPDQYKGIFLLPDHYKRFLHSGLCFLVYVEKPLRPRLHLYSLKKEVTEDRWSHLVNEALSLKRKFLQWQQQSADTINIVIDCHLLGTDGNRRSSKTELVEQASKYLCKPSESASHVIRCWLADSHK